MAQSCHVSFCAKHCRVGMFIRIDFLSLLLCSAFSSTHPDSISVEVTIHNRCIGQTVASKTFGSVVLSALHHTHISSCLHTEIRAPLLTTQSHGSTNTESGKNSQTTHTNLDVKQEKSIDDYWNIDGSRDLSDSWTGFTQFTLLEEKSPDRNMWSGERLTRKQLTSRPDHQWPEL